MKRLNLGCGDNVLEGWQNYDLYPSCDDVEQLDLNDLPLPLPDNYVPRIRMSHVLEHLTVNPYDVMREMHRILKQGGFLTVKVPVYCPIVEHTIHRFSRYYMNPIVTNPVHVLGVDLYSFFRGDGSPHGSDEYTDKLFRIVDFNDPIAARMLPLSLLRMFEYEYEWKLKAISNGSDSR